MVIVCSTNETDDLHNHPVPTFTLIPQNAGWVIVVAEIVAIVGVTALIAAAVLAWTGKKKSSEE
jgi:hypothetical protein